MFNVIIRVSAISRTLFHFIVHLKRIFVIWLYLQILNYKIMKYLYRFSIKFKNKGNYVTHKVVQSV